MKPTGNSRKTNKMLSEQSQITTTKNNRIQLRKMPNNSEQQLIKYAMKIYKTYLNEYYKQKRVLQTKTQKTIFAVNQVGCLKNNDCRHQHKSRQNRKKFDCIISKWSTKTGPRPGAGP